MEINVVSTPFIIRIFVVVDDAWLIGISSIKMTN